MKPPKKMVYKADAEEKSSSIVQEMASMPGLGQTISVRAAKTHLSALLDWVAEGYEVVVTSGGVGKARLVPLDFKKPQPVFKGTREHLARMPKWSGGPTAEEIVREDRDARGW